MNGLLHNWIWFCREQKWRGSVVPKNQLLLFLFCPVLYAAATNFFIRRIWLSARVRLFVTCQNVCLSVVVSLYNISCSYFLLPNKKVMERKNKTKPCPGRMLCSHILIFYQLSFCYSRERCERILALFHNKKTRVLESVRAFSTQNSKCLTFASPVK